MFRQDREIATFGGEVVILPRSAAKVELADNDDGEPPEMADLEPVEVLGAYLAGERHIAPLLWLLVDMDEAKRHTLLMMAQCLAAGTPTGDARA